MGNKINEFRKQRNLSVDQFAELMNYSISAITKYIYGEREPGKNFFKKLKQVFPDADINYFFD